MASKIFTTKKMNIEKKAWVRRSIIISAVIAIIGGVGFGGYMLTKEDPSMPMENRQVNRTMNDMPSNPSSAKPYMPAYSKSAADTSPFSQAQSTQSGFAKKESHSKKRSAHVSKHKKHKVAAHGKHKKHKYAGHKKHSKHKIATHKKHHKHKIAAHKKHHKHKIAANKKHKKHPQKEAHHSKHQLNRKVAEM